MNELILIDILDNVEPELVECFNIGKDVKREMKRRKRILGECSFSIDNFDVEKAIEVEARRKSEIKAFGRAVTPSEAATGIRIKGVKKPLLRKGAFRMTTTIAGICLGAAGVLAVIVKLKGGVSKSV